MAKANKTGKTIRSLNTKVLWVFAEKHEAYGLQLKAYNRLTKAFCIVGKLSTTGKLLSIWEETKAAEWEEEMPNVLSRIAFEAAEGAEETENGFEYRGEGWPMMANLRTTWEKYDDQQQERYNKWEDEYDRLRSVEVVREDLREQAVDLWNANPMSKWEACLFWTRSTFN